jgi:hypothetical protein
MIGIARYVTATGAVLMLGAIASMVTPADATPLNPGDILVADFEAGATGGGALYVVNGTTGARTVLTDFENSTQGPVGSSPFGVVARDGDTVYVIDNQGLGGNGALFQVRSDGTRTIFSDFSNASQGPLGFNPVGVALGRRGILVTDKDAGTNQHGAVFLVDPVTGGRTILSDFGDSAQGPTGESPTDITRGVGGEILIMDPDGGTDIPMDGKTGGNGALFKLDQATGHRILLSDFGDAGQGPTGVNPGGVSLGTAGFALVADTEAGTGGLGTLFKVDYLTGARTVLSSFGNMGQGAVGADPFFVTLAATGGILVTDYNGGTDIPLDGHTGGNGALFSVNPTNGTRTLLSDFGDPAKGPTGVDPVGVAIVPLTRPGDIMVISPFSGTSAAGELLAVNPATGSRVRVSDFGNAFQGPYGNDPVDLAQGTEGDILVVDSNVNSNYGALFRVNPVNGARTLLSGFNDPTKGPLGSLARGVALQPDGTILVITASGGTGAHGALFVVDPVTGNRTQASDFGDAAQGPLGLAPDSVVPGPPGFAFVIDPEAHTNGAAVGVLFSVDLATGARTIASDFNDATQGPTGKDPVDVELEPGGALLVADFTASPTATDYGVLCRVNPTTGARTILSDFGDPAQGPLGPNARGSAVDGTGRILVVDNAAGTGGAGLLYTVDPVTGARAILSDFGNASQGPIGATPFGVSVYVDAAAGCTVDSDCADADPCTLDSCAPAGVCLSAPAAAPGEVQGLLLDRTGNPLVAGFSWAAVGGATSYNVYRGSAFSLSDLSCFESGVAGTSATDDGAVPPPAGVFFHLVTAASCGNESTLGFDSGGAPRTSAVACP